MRKRREKRVREGGRWKKGKRGKSEGEKCGFSFSPSIFLLPRLQVFWEMSIKIPLSSIEKRGFHATLV